MAKNECVKTATESNCVPIHRHTAVQVIRIVTKLTTNNKHCRLAMLFAPHARAGGSLDDVMPLRLTCLICCFWLKYKSTSCMCGMLSC